MDKRVRGFAIFMTIFSLVISIPSIGHAQKAKEAYKVGVLSAQTGPGSVWGTEILETVRLAAGYINEKWDGINGHPLELIVEDTRTDPSIALTKCKRLDLDAKVPAIMVCISSPESLGIAQYANRARLPVLIHCGTLELVPYFKEKGSFSFRTWYTTKNQVDTVFAAFVARGVKTIGFMYEDSSFGASALEEIHELTKTNPNIQIVNEIKFDYAGLEFTADAIKMKAKNPDGILIAGSGVPSSGVVAKNIRESGYGGLIGVTSAVYTKIPQIGPIVNGVLGDVLGPVPGEAVRDVPNPTPELLKLLEWGEQKRRKTTATWVSMFGWDSVFALGAALKKVGPDREKIRDFLETYEYKGTAGTSRYSPGDHEGLKLLGTYGLMEARDGKWVRVRVK